MAEDVLDTLGEEQDAHQEATDQLIYDVLVEPAEHVNLPTSLVEPMLMRIKRRML